MKISCRLFPTLIAILVVCNVGAAESKPTGATKALYDLFDAEWEYGMKQSPTFASALGDRRYNDRWEDVGLANIEKQHLHSIETLDKIKKISRAKLSPKDQINYDLFQKEYETSLEGYKFHWYLVPLTQREGVQTQDELGDSLRFETIKDYEDWIARLNAFPLLVDQHIALMRQGMQERIVQPKITMQRVPAQIDKQITATPEASPFYKPLKTFPASIAKADQDRLTRLARQAVAEKIIPSFQKFKDFFTKAYFPACFDNVGAWQLPNGGEYYAFAARKFTTTKMTPAEIHQIGLNEVARIRTEMETIQRKVGYPGTLKDFFNHLRTDPKFFFKTQEELLVAYQATAKRTDPNLVKIFHTLPRLPYGVEPIPDKIAPDTTAAYYREPAGDGSRAGTYFVNLYKPEARPKWEMVPLSLHESVPGHHLQIALAVEQGELPKFRRFGGYTAFIEGWGLYAESLGDDMGLYNDPYDKFGQLTYEMWRAVRLVVDTGIHQFHWDRQKAIDYFMDNAPKTELDVVNEVDRYISWPGQALAYKIGQLKFTELRARAKKELGDKFDLREFHDIVLQSGALPLDVLERGINDYIATAKKRK